MQYHLKFFLILIALSSTSSCSEEFLKPQPLSFFSPENIYVDKAGFESVLVKMRKNLIYEQSGIVFSNLYHQWGTSECGVPIIQLDMRQLTPRSDPSSNFVGQINDFYGHIKDANVVISRIDKIEWQNQDERNQILSEAFWHRSYWYYRLVHNYGDVPWVGAEISSPRLDFNSHSRWAILDKIQADMEFAVQHLPETANPGSITKGAGNHLLAKIYLANMEFDKAISVASEVINGPYALMTERFGIDAGDPDKNVIWDLHRHENKNLPVNTENILSFVDRFESPEEAKGVGLYTNRIYHPAWSNSRNRDSEGNRGMIPDGPLYFDTLGQGASFVTLSEWYQYEIWEEDEYTWQNTPDLRRSDVNWFDAHEYRYNNPESVNYGEPWRLEWVTGNPYEALRFMYAVPIHKTNSLDGRRNIRANGSNGDWYIYRLAETYLIRAEAHFWLGNQALAADDINIVRKRSHAEPISADEVTIDYIFDERVRELFAESPRQNELVRVSFTMAALGVNGYNEETLSESNWYYDRVIRYNYFYPQYSGPTTETFTGLPLPIGDNLVVLGYSPNIQPHHFLWPIDDNLITANTEGRINQNNGYVGAENNIPPLETID